MGGLKRFRLDSTNGSVYIGHDPGSWDDATCNPVALEGPIQGFNICYASGLIHGIYLVYEDGCDHFHTSQFDLPTSIEAEYMSTENFAITFKQSTPYGICRPILEIDNSMVKEANKYDL